MIILHRSEILHSILLIASTVCDHVQVPDGTVGHQQAMLIIEVAHPTMRPFDHVIEKRQVLRVDPRHDVFERHGHARINVRKCDRVPLTR